MILVLNIIKMDNITEQLQELTLSNDKYASDNNRHLISLYRNIQSNPQDLLNNIATIIHKYQEADDKSVFYYTIRNNFNSNTSNADKSAMFLFLNKTCFRGVYRENKMGHFNVPYGNYKNPQIVSQEHVMYLHRLIKDVVFTCQDFDTSLSICKKKDFVYLDPPYAPEKDNSFVSYTKDGFNDRHEDLFNMCKELKCAWCMSNANVPFVLHSFQDNSKYKITVIECKRSINSKKPDSKTYEVIIQG
jgi:DNA adenine methylase